MHSIFLRFSNNPASSEDIAFVIKAVREINPKISETDRTEDTITFTSPDNDIDSLSEPFQAWLDWAHPIITTWRLVAQ
ncbi:hypothetical protein F1880_004355 [Penicillium rolfsii]|nr:hypothetical protein F1880_004355 [Penicillium rolfsii]